MHKNLIVVGNSMALTIDKPTRKLLGIGRDTKLRVTTDGRRLVVEPIVEKAPGPTASELDALPVFMTLMDRFGMSKQQFAQLHHGTTAMFAYLGWLKSGLAKNADDDDRTTFRRFEACLRALQHGASWDDAIAVALHAEPKPGGVATSHTNEHVAEHARDDAPRSSCIDETIVVPDPSLYLEDEEDELPADGVTVSWDEHPAR